MSSERLPAETLVAIAVHHGSSCDDELTTDFALIEGNPLLLQRLHAVHDLAAQHNLMWMVVDDIQVTWSSITASSAAIWTNVFQNSVSFERYPTHGSSAATVTVKLSKLIALAEQIGRLHFVYDARWSEQQKTSFRYSVVESLVRQQRLTPAAAHRYAQSC